MKIVKDERGNLTYTMIISMLLSIMTLTIVTLLSTQVLANRNADGNRKATYLAQGAMDSLNDYLLACANCQNALSSWMTSFESPKTYIDVDRSTVTLIYSIISSSSSEITYQTKATVTQGNHTASQTVNYSSVRPTAPLPPTIPTIFSNNVVMGTTGTAADIASWDNPSQSMDASGYTVDPNFATHFTTYLNKQFDSQPKQIPVVTPSPLTTGNKSISPGSTVTLPPQLYSGTIFVNNRRGDMTIGDQSTVGTTVLYGSSCNFEGIANLEIYGDVVCNGPITFNDNISSLKIHGNLISSQNIDFNQKIDYFAIDKSVSAGGSITFKNNISSRNQYTQIAGDLIGNGITFTDSITYLSVLGNISSTQNLTANNDIDSLQVGKSVYVSGNSSFATLDSVSILGSFYDKGNITFNSTISNKGSGFTVGNEMLSGDTINFDNVKGHLRTGNFIGALNSVNFNHNLSSSNKNNQNIKFGGISAGSITVDNTYPPNIFIQYNPPGAPSPGEITNVGWSPVRVE